VEADMDIIYYEDIVVGDKTIVGQHQTDKSEIHDFAREWDRQPFHMDEEAAKSYPYGGIIAPAPYILSVITRLASSPDRPTIAAVGLLEYEHIKIFNPVHPGDLLTVTIEPVEKRELKSTPDRGIVRYWTEVRNQRNEVVLNYVSVCLVAKRPI
jgi:acyl dehydratase